MDIGEVDLIVCYETAKGAIRNLQRAGRTGRQRDGRLELLLTEGREEENWEKSKAKYEDVQFTIRSANLELYKDVERLLPEAEGFYCDEHVMEIQPYERAPSASTSKLGSAAEASTSGRGASDNSFDEADSEDGPAKRSSKKRKRNSDPTRNIPDGATNGFVSVADLIQKGSKRSRKDPGDSVAKRGSKKAEPQQETLTPSQLVAQMESADEYEAEVARAEKEPIPKGKGKGKGKAPAKSKVKKAPTRSEKAKPVSKTTFAVKSKSSSKQQRITELDHSVIDLCDSSPAPTLATQPSAPSWLLSDGSDGEPGPFSKRLSPPANSPMLPVATSFKFSSSSDMPPAIVGFQSARSVPRIIPDGDSDSDVEVITSTPARIGRSSRTAMLPPPLPAQPSPFDISMESPEPFSQAIRAPGARRLRKLPDVSLESSPPISSQIRARGFRRSTSSSSTSPSPPPKRRKHRHRDRADPVRRADRNGLLDDRAIHSGDDEHAGDTSASDEEESESDRMFVTELDPTQASPSYDQSNAYRHGLLTQAPSNGPAFRNGPVRGMSHLNMREHGIMRANKRAAGVSSSPVQPDRTISDYEDDSFVVRDDEEILYDSSF